MEMQTLTWNNLRSHQRAGIHVHRINNHDEGQAHDHLFHELVYVESGTAEHQSVAPTRRLRPGDLIIMRPRIWHGYRRPRQLAILNCLFDPRLIQRLAPFLTPVVGTLELFRQPCRNPDREAPVVLHLTPAQRPLILDPLRRMLAEQQDQPIGWMSAMAASLLELLVVTARLHTQPLPTQQARLADQTDQAVLDTVSHLEAHYDQPVLLNDLAHRVSLSPAHLSRSFSRRMGMGVVEFVHHLRCEEACRLLRWTEQSISRIAIEVGYNEIAYFSRRFRQQVGCSPRQFRHGKELVGQGRNR